MRVSSDFVIDSLRNSSDDDDGDGDEQQRRRGGGSDFFPSTIRAILLGASGSGKSNLLCNILCNDDWIDYTRLFVVSKTLFQPCYELLRDCLSRGLTKSETRECFRQKRMVFSGSRSPPPIVCEFHESVSSIPHPSDLDPSESYVVVLDDILFEPNIHAKIGPLFAQGRHSCVSVFLLAQNWFLLDRATVRTNANLLFVFKQSTKTVSHIYADLAPDIELEEFRDYLSACWKNRPYGFATIDVAASPKDGRFRREIDEFYFPRYLLFDEEDDDDGAGAGSTVSSTMEATDGSGTSSSSTT